MSKNRQRVHIYLEDEDRERLEFLKQVNGTTFSQSVRAALRHACHLLGMETARTNFFENNTPGGGPS